MSELTHMEAYRQANSILGLVAANVFVANDDREKVTLYAEQLRLQHYKRLYQKCDYTSEAARVFTNKRPPALVRGQSLQALINEAGQWVQEGTIPLEGRLSELRKKHDELNIKLTYFDENDASDEVWSEAAMELNIVGYEYAIYIRFLKCYGEGETVLDITT